MAVNKLVVALEHGASERRTHVDRRATRSFRCPRSTRLQQDRIKASTPRCRTAPGARNPHRSEDRYFCPTAGAAQGRLVAELWALAEMWLTPTLPLPPLGRPPHYVSNVANCCPWRIRTA